MTFVLLVVFELARLALRALLMILVFHLSRAAWTSSRKLQGRAPPPLEDWPTVTVQLPIRNEFYVVERLLEAVSRLDYPRDKLEIQVLDDSSDETRTRVAELAERLRAEGHRVQHVTRAEPTGYKAGALNHGLASAEGEFLAMFDADCVPGRDFLRNVLPWFTEPDVGCVQVRWSFLNRSQSVLTRLQAIVLDGLFIVDQPARAGARLPLQFNGTNGVWRRAAIAAAGGFSPDIVAEDADLSFRAYLAGFRVVHLRDHAVPTEIPEDMAAFRSQQRRWALGSAQILRTLGLRILGARVPARAKLMMLMHLGRHAIDPLILLACLTSPFTTLYSMPFLVDYGTWLNAGLVGMVLAASFVFYGAALRRSGAPARELLLVPLVIPLVIGLSLVYTVAFFQGVVSRSAPFERTPKAGSATRGAAGPRYRAPKDPVAWLELGFALAHAGFAVSAARVGIWAYSGFFAIVALSFGWVSIATLTSRGVGALRAAPRD